MDREGSWIKVAVDFHAREDGGLRAVSPDVPGLFLSGEDADAVLRDAGPAIEHLCRVNMGLDLEMHPLTSAREYLETQGVIRPGPGSRVEFAGRPKAA